MSEALELVGDGQGTDGGIVDGVTNSQLELGPFWLDPDEMLLRLPSVAASLAARQGTLEAVTRETYRSNDNKNKLAQTYLDFCWQGGCLLDTPGGEQQLDAAIVELFSPLREPVRTAATKELLSNAQHIATLINGFKEFSEVLIKQVNGDILNDREATFDLIAYIADVHNTGHNRGSDMTADLLNYSDDKLLPHLRDALKAGEYDDILYGRLLKFIRHTESAGLNNRLLKILEVMTLTSDILYAYVETNKDAIEDVTTASVDSLMLQVLERLPVQYRSHFNVHKEELVRALDASLARSIGNLKDIQNNANPLTSFVETGNRYLEAVRLHHITIHAGKARGRTVIQDPQQRAFGVRSRLRARAGDLVAAEITPSEVISIRPRELVRLRNENGRYGECIDGDTIGCLIEDYLGNYGDNPAMRAFLRTALERLVELDLSHGPVPGYKKLGNAVKIRLTNGTLKPIFEYIPGDDPEISTTAPDANLLRILVVNLGQRRFGAVTAIRKPDVHSYLRNRGMGDTQKK